MTSSTEKLDMIDILVADHRDMEELFVELERGSADREERRRRTDAIIAELVRHSVAEEAYLYPTARRVLPDGDKVADDEIVEHTDAEETMKALDGLDVDDPRFDAALNLLISTIRAHVEDEETSLFPRLRDATSPDDLRELGRKIGAIKRFAPTHPTRPRLPTHH
jgi:hemerythrin superfamily protein